MTNGSIAAHVLNHRLVMVTGKGGVGKSTVAAALAVAAQKAGHRVLLVELGARPVMGELLGGRAPGHVPKQIAASKFPNLSVSRLDARLALQEYLLDALKVRSLARLATENRVLARLWQAAPSVDEMSILTAIERFEAEVDPSNSKRPRYDTIVVDMPSTGHAKTMLAVPRGALGMIRVGALAEKARTIDALLHDPQKTAIVVTTLPEELPVNESIELVESLRCDLELDTAAIVINAVLPQIYDEDERSLIDRLAAELEDDAARKLLDAATHHSVRHHAQVAHIDKLQTRLQIPFIEIAFAPDQSLGMVEHMAQSFATN